MTFSGALIDGLILPKATLAATRPPVDQGFFETHVCREIARSEQPASFKRPISATNIPLNGITHASEPAGDKLARKRGKDTAGSLLASVTSAPRPYTDR